MSEVKYKRILLKLSGEALAGENKTGISPEVLDEITSQIKDLKDLGVEVAIVVGGGNFWRGKYGHNMEKTTSDYMGMLATTINAQQFLPIMYLIQSVLVLSNLIEILKQFQ